MDYKTALDNRLRQVEAAKSHNRKILYTIVALTVTSLVVVAAKF